MTIRYAHRRLSPAEFSRLLNDAGFSVDDFIYLTGRRRDQLERFLTGQRQDYIPTMAEVLILELVKAMEARGTDDSWVTAQTMYDIVRTYDAGPPPKKQNRKEHTS